MAKAILYDSTQCVGCRQCEVACSARWGFPYDDRIAEEQKLSAHKVTAVQVHGERFSRRMCMHCQDPTCASVCPVGALRKSAAGPVVYDETKCMGCRYCIVACPFHVPVYEWSMLNPRVRKCDMCSDRTSINAATRCTEACPTGATLTGERSQMIAEARKRLREKPNDYLQQIYGIEEAGGTSVLVLSAVPFEQIGYDPNVLKSPLPALTRAALEHVPDVVAAGGVLMGGIYWITHRREEVARKEGEK